jgi:nucleoside-diphosphate-sugar epimerase
LEDSLSEKSVLITGAAGFIGSHLAERCLERGWRVTAVDAFTDYYDESFKRRNVEGALRHPAYRLVEGDLLDLEIDALFDDVGVVFHLAAQPGVRISWDQFDVYVRLNLIATQRLLHAARGRELEKFVIASSSSIYGDAETLPTREDVLPRPVSPYGVTKVATEHLAQVYWRNFAVPSVCLRYFTVYGPRQRADMAFHRLLNRALADEPFEVYGDGEQTRDFTFVADAVNGTLAAAEAGAPGVSYNLGGGSRRTLNSVLELLERLLERPVRRTYVERQVGDARDTAADITLASRDLGFQPSVSFEQGLAAQLEWQRGLTLGLTRASASGPQAAIGP